VDQLMGLNTSVYGADGVFFDGFLNHWSTWKEFHEHFDVFLAYQRFPLRSTTSVEKRNRQIRRRKNVLEGRGSDVTDTSPVIPGSWKVHCKTLKCTHGIKQKKRVGDHRTDRFVRYTKCTAQVNATLQRRNGEYYIFLRAKGSHNHALSRELWEYYVKNRRIQDPIILQPFGDMRESGSSAKGIFMYLRKRAGTAGSLSVIEIHDFSNVWFAVPDEETTLQDVHNTLLHVRSGRRGGHLGCLSHSVHPA